MTQNTYIEIMQERLDWCVKHERYEMASRIRNLITSITTDDEKFEQQYYLDLIKKYAPNLPEYYEIIKKKYEN